MSPVHDQPGTDHFALRSTPSSLVTLLTSNTSDFAPTCRAQALSFLIGDNWSAVSLPVHFLIPRRGISWNFSWPVVGSRVAKKPRSYEREMLFDRVMYA